MGVSPCIDDDPVDIRIDGVVQPIDQHTFMVRLADIRKDAFSFSHPEASVSDVTWRLSNFNPQRMFIDLQPDYTLFKDDNGITLSPENLKRMNINKAELVLYIKKDLPNLSNTYSYFANAFLVKESPEAPEIINTTNLESIAFAYPLINSATNTADSLVINITPILQAYTSGKKEAKGIVIISTYERKDFGEIEFYHPLDITAPEGKQPYIRVKYTPPYL